MRMRFLVASAFIATCLRAQQDPMKLTLADAEQLAIKNNPHISAAQMNAAAAHQTPLEYRASLSPQMTGSVTGVGADSGSRLAAGGLNNPAVYSRLATGVAASQMLTDFGRTRSLVASADLQAQAQDQVAGTARADVLIATARAYFGVLRANAVLKVARQTVSSRQTIRDKVNALFQNNLKSGLDASFADVNLADSQLFLAQAQNDVKSAEATLATAIGLPAQAEFSLAEEAMGDALPPQSDTLIQQAIQDRPELKDLRLEQNSAERFAQAEHALNYPVIAAVGAVGIVPAGEAAVPGRYGAAGVNVNIPIFNGGLYRARQTEAEFKAKPAAERVRDEINLIIRDVRTAYLNASTAFQRVGLTDQLLTQAGRALDLAQGRYDLGLSSIVELSEAQLNLTSAQIAHATAQYDYQSQRLLVDYQTGALK